MFGPVRPCHLLLIVLAMGSFDAFAQVPDPNQSDALLLACPQGDATSVVFVRDAQGQPIPGLTVILEAEFAQGPWSPCDPAALPPVAQTELDGGARFQLAWAGWAQGLEVYVDDGNGPQLLFANQVVAGFDLDGNGVVDAMDLNAFQTLVGQPAPEADYNFDGQVGVQDELLFMDHANHECQSTPSTQFQVQGAGGAIDLIDDELVADISFASGSVETAEASLGLGIAFGPESPDGSIEIALDWFSGSIDPTPSPLGDSGHWQLGLVEDDPTILGTWDIDNTFSLGPFDVLFSCTATDSVLDLGNGVENLPVSIDYVERGGDTLQCVIEGTIVQEDGGFSAIATLRALDGQQGAWQSVNGFQSTMLIGNFDPNGKVKAEFKLLRVKRICWELCMMPVIICDDNGQNCGLSIAGRYRGEGKILEETRRIMAQACVKLREVSPLVLNSSAIRDYEASNPNKRTMANFKRLIRRHPKYKTFFGPRLEAIGFKDRDCVLAMFVDGAGIHHKSGAYADARNGDKVLINHKLVDEKCANEEGVPANNRVLAHELIHTLGIEDHTTGDPKSCMHDCAEGGGIEGGKDKGATEMIEGETSHAGRIVNKSGSKGKLRRTRNPCYGEFRTGKRSKICLKVK